MVRRRRLQIIITRNHINIQQSKKTYTRIRFAQLEYFRQEERNCIKWPLTPTATTSTIVTNIHHYVQVELVTIISVRREKESNKRERERETVPNSSSIFRTSVITADAGKR